jgi:hypothetical protein
MEPIRIMVKCPDCVETRVGLRDVTLRYCLDDERWSYRFTCRLCGLPGVAPTSENAARQAAAAGCPVEHWRFPAELLEHRPGPELTLADLYRLHKRLLEPDWFDELLQVHGENQAF